VGSESLHTDCEEATDAVDDPWVLGVGLGGRYDGLGGYLGEVDSSWGEEGAEVHYDTWPGSSWPVYFIKCHDPCPAMHRNE
jgi:hypothetical protein